MAPRDVTCGVLKSREIYFFGIQLFTESFTKRFIFFFFGKHQIQQSLFENSELNTGDADYYISCPRNVSRALKIKTNT